MYRASILLIILVAVLLISCGGSESGAKEEGATPAATEGTPVPISVSEQGVQPQQMEIEVGKVYKIVLTNLSTTTGHTLVCQRYCGSTFAGPGLTVESTVFTPTQAGEVGCWDRNRGREAAFKCTIVVK